MKPPVDNTTPLYNSRLIASYIKLVKSKYSYVSVSELLQHANIEPYQVEDEGHWFTQEQVDRFYEMLRKLTGNDAIAREAGRFAASPENLSMWRQYVLGLVGPERVYEIIGYLATTLTKSAVYEAKKIAPTKVRITVSPREGVNEKPFQCENRIGYFEAASTVFNYRLPKVEHPECLFKGGKVCAYTVSWQLAQSDLLKKVKNWAAFSLSALSLLVYFYYPEATLQFLLPFTVLVFFLFTYYAHTMEKKELSAAIDNLRSSNDKLLEQVNLNYNNALMVNEVGVALSKQTDVDDILANVIHVLETRLDYDRGMILLADEDRKKLVFHAGFGYDDEKLNILKGINFHLDRPDSKGVFVVSFHKQKPFLINDVDEIAGTLSPRSFEFAKRMGAKSFICCPIIYEAEPVGVLVVDNIKRKKPLLQSDINLLMGIAPSIAISIHNAKLIHAKERQFTSLLQTLAASIDARDPLTAGHSERVTEYSVGICKELGMPKDYCEMIRVASLLHDYGKIGIKDSILKKEDALSHEEFEEIKTHVLKTRRILDQINFEGIYKEVPKIAESHHEKMDGSGYPKGLRGDEIPLGAKIIAVADFFEAVTSKRHYRDPMSLDVAFELLVQKSDHHFDGAIVQAFIRYYSKTYLPSGLIKQ